MQHAQNPWFLASTLTCTLGWMIAYVLIIRRGFIEKTYGMPLVPLCVNFSYEFLFSVVWPDEFPVYIGNFVWFLIDAVMVFQYLRYGRREWAAHQPGWLFYPTFVAVLAMAATGIATLTIDTNDQRGGSLTGWGAQLLLGAGYIYLLLRRNSPKGQSMYIGISRLVGTVALIYAQEIYMRPFMFLRFVYVAFIALDVTYLWLLYRTCRACGVNPWRRL